MSGPSVLVDTNVFVSARNRRERGHGSCQNLLDRIDRGELHAVVSTVTIAEVRAGISAEEVPSVWRAIISHLHTSPNYQVAPVSSEVAEAAGELRSSSNLPLPDALIVATGMLAGVSALVTQDKEMARKQRALTVKAPTDDI